MPSFLLRAARRRRAKHERRAGQPRRGPRDGRGDVEERSEEAAAAKKQNLKKAAAKEGVNYKKLSNRLKTIERKIETLEGELTKLQEVIYQDSADEKDLQIKVGQVKTLKKDIEKKYEEWAEVSQLLEQ